MRPIRPNRRALAPALATGGVLALLGITAVPMLSVWSHSHDTDVPASDAAPLYGSWNDNLGPEIVVDLRDNVTDTDVRDMERRYGLDLKANSFEVKDDRLYVASVPAQSEADVLARLRTDSRVESAEDNLTVSIPESLLNDGGSPNDGSDLLTFQTVSSDDLPAISVSYVTREAVPDPTPYYSVFAPNDPRYPEQWNFRMIGAEDAWKRSRGRGVVVAVIDTGVAGPSKKGPVARDFKQTKFTAGYDFVNKDADAYDDQGHGTHVAGTIAESTNNNEGVAGLAFDATIMPIKVLSASGSGTSADVAEGIRFAADHGANVINMSLGSSSSSTVIQKACQYAYKKGVTIVCAAGNGFGQGVGYPAAYPECIAVSAVGPSGKIAKYSSYGKQVALCAPGGDMIDSKNPADGILQNTVFNNPDRGGHGDDYYAFQGTSMASPHVAAVAALIEAEGVNDPAKVRDILVKTAKPNGDSNKYGAGIVSAARATAKAAESSAVKLRHLLLVGFGCLLFLVGGGRRRSLGLRAAMAGALAVGMFGPDAWTNLVGADSAWNLLTFSALIPMAAYALLRRGPSVKVAGALALGTAINLYANWHNGSLPFTTATFGDAALPWTFANLSAAIALGIAAALRAFRAVNPSRRA